MASLWFTKPFFKAVNALWLVLKALLCKHGSACKDSSLHRAREDSTQTEAKVSITTSETPAQSHGVSQPTRRQKKNLKKGGKSKARENSQESCFTTIRQESIEDVPAPNKPELTNKIVEGDDPMEPVDSDVLVDQDVSVLEDLTNEIAEMKDSVQPGNSQVMLTQEVETKEVHFEEPQPDANPAIGAEEEMQQTEEADPSPTLTCPVPTTRLGLLKESFKLSKKLREIEALEQQAKTVGTSLDKLQTCKIQKKAVIEAKLDTINNALAKLTPDADNCIQVATSNSCKDCEEAVHVYALDAQGQPVLQYTSSLCDGNVVSPCKSVGPESPQTVSPSQQRRAKPSPRATKASWTPTLRHHVNDQASENNVLASCGPLQRLDNNFQWQSSNRSKEEVPSASKVASAELHVSSELETLGPPPGLMPPGLVHTAPAGASPDFGLLTTPHSAREVQCSSKEIMVEGIEIQGLLQSISFELERRANRVASNFTCNSCSPCLSRQSSQSDLSTKASSADENISPNGSPQFPQSPMSPWSPQSPSSPQSLNGGQFTSERGASMPAICVNSSALWDDLLMPTRRVDCAVDYSQYFGKLSDYSTYDAPAPWSDPVLVDHSVNNPRGWSL